MGLDSDTINIVSTSDFHIGNPNINTKKLYNDLQTYLYPKLVDCDILFIAGDFFHTLLYMNNVASFYSVLIINDLYSFAVQYGFLIRVVEGTFSHDREQNMFFNVRNDKNDKNDRIVKVIESIEIEHINTYGIDVLYVPDDRIDSNPNEVLDGVFYNSGKEKVDMVIGHGYFRHELPYNIPEDPPGTLDLNYFKDKVKGFIAFGHVHTPSTYKFFISNGCFERHAHGEEEDKGFFVLDYNKTSGEVQKEFIVNENATKFITCDIANYTNHEAACKFVLDKLKSVKEDEVFHFRLVHDDSTFRESIGNFIAQKFNKATIKYKNTGMVKQVDSEELDIINIDLPKITPINLPDYVVQYTADKLNSTLNLSEVNMVLDSV